ncbi:stage II sporulation protein D [Evansella tamaricis]|uniref:Stage II sporulation protein D n=1 Tax=Evansella tamaricis TaxID=2069301 RepID=A0ABS6JBM5_9BACI|nr:stage II sporulation protein D [Evansella tamaricis]MBU9710589.1 stage II sporulation protein D [Evansella tamaricis]
MKQLMIVCLLLIGLVLVVPSILVVGFSDGDSASQSTYTEEGPVVSEEEVEEVWIEGAEDAAETVAVFRSERSVVEHIPFEDYIVGVVAKEMPAEFELEALKAQALTARTYIIQLMGVEENLPLGADVTDTDLHQVFSNDEELREQWGSEYDWKIARIREAVYATEGMVITYDGYPIDALYYSTSNGLTENSEEYWSNEYPYLRSVESPWDLESPRYLGHKEMSVGEFEEKLGISVAEHGIGQIVGRTTGGRVEKVVFGDKEFTGREIREELLGLNSADFTWERRGDTIHIETRGWGHGVGMSQYGAHGMAQEGHSFEEIIHHYYQGVEISEVNQVMSAMVAKESR